MATISTLPELSGYPVADVVSYADSPIGENSTGEIYMLLTDLHSPEQDLLVDNKLTLLFSMAQYKNCSDPMEPTCARLMMTGSKSRIEENTEEHDFAMRALLSRHPRIKMWILYPYHEFYLAKVKIEYIMLQDFYGRPTNVPVDEYFTADPSTLQRRSEYLLIIISGLLNIFYFPSFQSSTEESVGVDFIRGTEC